MYQNKVNSSLISTCTSQGRKLDKQKGKILFTIEAGSEICSSVYLNIPEITTYCSPQSACTKQNSAVSYVTKNDSAIFIPKMTHITLSSDNEVNLLKPFCRWVWRFFYSGHRNAWTVHSQVTLLYISAVETCLTCLFRHKTQEDHSDKAK